jgi:hypothetical protein
MDKHNIVLSFNIPCANNTSKKAFMSQTKLQNMSTRSQIADNKSDEQYVDSDKEKRNAASVGLLSWVPWRRLYLSNNLSTNKSKPQKAIVRCQTQFETTDGSPYKMRARSGQSLLK